jgi:hypothetical protein
VKAGYGAMIEIEIMISEFPNKEDYELDEVI